MVNINPRAQYVSQPVAYTLINLHTSFFVLNSANVVVDILFTPVELIKVDLICFEKHFHRIAGLIDHVFFIRSNKDENCQL